MWIGGYPFRKSVFEMNLDPCNISRISLSHGIWNRYLIVIWLIAQLSTHMLLMPPFFCTNSSDTIHGLLLSPYFFGSSSIFFLKIFHSGSPSVMWKLIKTTSCTTYDVECLSSLASYQVTSIRNHFSVLKCPTPLVGLRAWGFVCDE